MKYLFMLLILLVGCSDLDRVKLDKYELSTDKFTALHDRIYWECTFQTNDDESGVMVFQSRVFNEKSND